jgi:hypothetical protein
MKKDWTSIISEQKASGESVSHFCKSQVLSTASGSVALLFFSLASSMKF